MAEVDVLARIFGLGPDPAGRGARERDPIGRAALVRPVNDREAVVDCCAERIDQLTERDAEPIGLALRVAHDVHPLDVGQRQTADDHRCDLPEDERFEYGARIPWICSSAMY